MRPYIGQPLPRFEDQRLLTGQGRFTDDIRLPGAAACAFVRSPHAHARILGVRTEEARELPGVLAVLTAADYAADGLAPLRHAANPADALDISRRAFAPDRGALVIELPMWPLAQERVRYAGEPVVAVIAETAAVAHDAAERVDVDYESLPAVVSPSAAIARGAPSVWDEAKDNVVVRQAFGDSEAVHRALQRAALVVEHEFVANRIANCQLEPRAAIGAYDSASGLYTVMSGNQGVTRIQMALAAAFKVEREKVRVVCPDVGGAFGSRTDPYPEQVVVAWAAKRLGRAVHWTSTRSEAFLSDYQGRDNVARTQIGFDAQGRILGYRVEFLSNVGAHTVSFVTAANVQRMLPTLYQVPALHAEICAIVTNTVPTAPYRGAGRPEAHHLLERLLDIGARRLGIDRAEIRRRNLVRRDMLPYRSAAGLSYDAGDFAGNMERSLEAANWRGFAARRDAARKSGKLLGIGIANYVASPVGAPIERVGVQVHARGTIDVIVGTQSTGQGHETSFAQVLADQFGVAIDRINVRYGDSAFVTLGGGTHSDRSLRLAGTLMVNSAKEVIERGRTLAAARLETAVADIAYESGKYRVVGTDREVSLFEVAAMEPLATTQDFKGRLPAYPTGAAVCEVQVDPETGSAVVTGYMSVDDAGRVVNPMIVDGQMHGGIAQGIGQALLEGVAWDAESGQTLTGSFMDYGICRADDLPSFRVTLTEDPTQGNPLGIKGGGEGGIVPATAAVVNALCDALSIDDLQMPAAPAAVWRALGRKV